MGEDRGINIGIAVRAGIALSLLDPPLTKRETAADTPDDPSVALSPPVILAPEPAPAPAPIFADIAAVSPAPLERIVDVSDGQEEAGDLTAGSNDRVARGKWIDRHLWHPFLRWIDRRIRRALDRSDLLLAMQDRIVKLDQAIGTLPDIQRDVATMRGEIRSDLQLLGERADAAHAATFARQAQSAAEIERKIVDLAIGVRDYDRRLASLDLVLEDRATLDRARFDSLHLAIEQIAADDLRSSLSTVVAALADIRSGYDHAVTKAGEDERRQAASDRLTGEIRDRLVRMEVGLAGRNARDDRLTDYVESLMQRNCLVLDDAFAIRSDTGYLLCPITDLALAVALIETRGCLEPGTRSVILSLLRPGDTVLDVGANVGTLTLPIAHAVGDRGHVIAVEPTPQVADLLRRTIELNGFGQTVTIHQCAASDHVGVIDFSTFGETTHNHRVRDEMDGRPGLIRVPIVPLDQLVEAGTVIRLVKIDVEGDELLVWRGMRRLVADNPDIAVILEFGPSHLRDLDIAIDHWTRELQVDGFRLWEISEADGTIAPLRTEGLDALYSVNMLLMRGSPPSDLFPSAGQIA